MITMFKVEFSLIDNSINSSSYMMYRILITEEYCWHKSKLQFLKFSNIISTTNRTQKLFQTTNFESEIFLIQNTYKRPNSQAQTYRQILSTELRRHSLTSFSRERHKRKPSYRFACVYVLCLLCFLCNIKFTLAHNLIIEVCLYVQHQTQLNNSSIS